MYVVKNIRRKVLNTFLSEKKKYHRVAFLPFNNKGIWIRKEPREKLGKGLYPTVGTGTVEANETKEETAIREIREEIGFSVKKEDLIPLGNLLPSKTTGENIFLFAVNINNKKHKKEIGDGSWYEAVSQSFFVPWKKVNTINDALLYGFLWKLLEKGIISNGK